VSDVVRGSPEWEAKGNERSEKEKFKLERGRMGCGCGGGSAISFRTTTFRFHRSYTSRWIPIRQAGLYLVLSPFQWRWPGALDCRNKINARENEENRVNRSRERARRNLKLARLGIVGWCELTISHMISRTTNAFACQRRTHLRCFVAAFIWDSSAVEIFNGRNICSLENGGEGIFATSIEILITQIKIIPDKILWC